MATALGIRLLGGFALTFGDRSDNCPVTGLSGRSQRLLAYILLHRHQPQPRERVAFQLWPDSGETQARANLRKELSQLRRLLPQADRYLQTAGQALQWLGDHHCTLDVAAFEAARQAAEQAQDLTTQRQALEQAVRLYGGDLLPTYDDDWVVPERERLRRLQSQSLEDLVALLADQQQYSAALTYGQQWLRLDRLNEAAYGALMRVYGQMGDRASALQTYHQCMAHLRDELGLDPSTTTRTLYETLLRDETLPPIQSPLLPHPPTPPFPHAPTPPPLIGREAEWATLRQWASPILQAQRGHSAEVLLLLGEPGIGKTRLLEELRTLAQTHQAQVLWGQSFAAEMMRPFGLWIDLLRAAAVAPGAIAPGAVPSDLGFLLPELGSPAQAPTDLSHLFDAVVQRLTHWAQQAPLLLLLDDIQWMDDASSALLHYALRLLQPLPVLVACTARAGELDHNGAVAQLLQALSREQRLHRFHLHPLDRAQTATLLQTAPMLAVEQLTAATVEQVFVGSGGNPLYALEMGRALAQEATIDHATLDALMGDRLRQLDEAARDFLPWAAALGRSFDPATVARMADYPMAKLLTTVEQLEQQGIIRPQVGAALGYDFAHDRLRQVVYQQLSEPRRRLMHGQIALYLHQRSAQAGELATEVVYHAALAHDYALAAAATLAAADRSLKLFAYAEALGLAGQGLDYCQHLDAASSLPLRAQLLRVCVVAGPGRDRLPQIEADLQQTLQQAQALGLTEAVATGLEATVMLQFGQNNFAAVHQRSLQAAEASRVASPATAAHMLAYSGTCLAEIGRDMLRAEGLLLEARSLAERVGVEFCDVFCGLGCVHRHYGRYDDARSHLRRAWQLATAQQDHWREFTALTYLAMTELDAGDPAAALISCDQMAAVAEQIQGEGSESAVAAALGSLMRYRLQPSAAAVDLRRAIATLHQVDAKRLLAYLLTRAAEQVLPSQPDLAADWATTALDNAQIVNHPSEIALSGAVLIQSLWRLGEKKRATVQFETLEDVLSTCMLSAKAEAALDQVRHTLFALASGARNAPTLD